MKIRYDEYLMLCGNLGEVVESDLPEKLNWIKENMIELFIQEGDGLTSLNMSVVKKHFDIVDTIDIEDKNVNFPSFDAVEESIRNFCSIMDEGGLVKHTFDVIPNNFLVNVSESHEFIVNEIRELNLISELTIKSINKIKDLEFVK